MKAMDFEYTIQHVDRLPETFELFSANSDVNIVVNVIIFIIIIVGFLLLARWLVCWFSKTNQLVQQNKKIIALLEQIRFNTAPK